ncbi:hypothetical protein FRC16_001479, partial [Serendipita sp. 398]
MESMIRGICPGGNAGTLPSPMKQRHSEHMRSVSTKQRHRTSLLIIAFLSVGMGLGNHAAADKGGDCDPVLSTMDECVRPLVLSFIVHTSSSSIHRFPTINALAESNIEAINALWKGLGYYSRAARLLEGAKLVVENFDGKLPDDAATLQKEVPGIGRYSAGAICSIAYGKCVPVLDGNVHRLLSRILALHSSPKAKSTTDILWKAAEAIVKGSSNPGAVNQALIELGSTVCTPKNPKCGGCPIKENCAAFTWKMGKNAIKDIEDECGTCDPILEGPKDVTIFPMKVEKKAVPEETDVVCTISWQSQDHVTKYYLLRKRPAHGLLAGLWDFPVVPNVGTSDPKSLEKYALELVSTAFPRLKSEKEDDSPDGDEGEPLHVSSVKVVGSVLHVFSHVKKTFQVVSIMIQGKDSSSSSSSEEATQPPDAIPGKWMDDAQREPDEDEECVKPPAKKKQK